MREDALLAFCIPKKLNTTNWRRFIPRRVWNHIVWLITLQKQRGLWLKKFVLLGYFIKHKALYFWRVHNHTVWFQTRLGKNLLQSVVYIYTIIRAYFEGHQNRHLYQKNVQVCTTLIFGKQIKLPNQFGNIHADSTFIIDLRSNFGSTMTKLCKI